jgi:hypothetical protein
MALPKVYKPEKKQTVAREKRVGKVKALKPKVDKEGIPKVVLSNGKETAEQPPTQQA